MLKQDFDVKKRTPVALAMRKLPEMLILMVGIAAAGGVFVFMNAWWTSKELGYALDDSSAKIIFADGIRSERLTPSQRDKSLTLIGVRDGKETLHLAYSKFLKKTDKKVGLKMVFKVMTILRLYTLLALPATTKEFS